jgi:hypothetical protein
MAGKTENGSLNPWRLLVTNAVKCPLTIGSGSPVIQARPSEMTARTTSSVCRLTVNWLQVAEDSFRANPCWMALFLRFPSADLKIGAIARIVVGCYRTRHNQSDYRPGPPCCRMARDWPPVGSPCSAGPTGRGFIQFAHGRPLTRRGGEELRAIAGRQSPAMLLSDLG